MPVAFTREVVPVLSSAGCNQGACHGAAHGRGGFRLSLLGFDPAFDHSRSSRAPRAGASSCPIRKRSILLLKPTLVDGARRRRTLQGRIARRTDAAPLAGGRRPGAGREATQRHRPRGLAGEALHGPRRAAADPRPRRPGATAAAEDVTATAQFDALNDGVATVTPAGLVTAHGRGETHIMVRFGGQATVVQVTLPYGRLAGLSRGLPANNFIDEKLIAKWKDLGLTPSPLCTDEEFFRRLYLDAIGTLPTPADVKAFLADNDPDKRKKAIDSVLDRPEFVDFWALKWGDLLRINRDAAQREGHVELPQLGAGQPARQQADRRDGPRHHHRRGQHLHRRAGQLLPDVAQRRPTGPRRRPRSSSACACSAPSAIITRSRSGARTITTAWPRSSSGWAPRAARSSASSAGETVVYLRPTGEQTHPRKGGVVKPHPLDGPDDGRPVRPPPQAGRVADGEGQPVLRPQHRQSLLGLHDGPRPGRAARRHARHQPGQQPGTARRPGRRTSSRTSTT